MTAGRGKGRRGGANANVKIETNGEDEKEQYNLLLKLLSGDQVPDRETVSRLVHNEVSGLIQRARSRIITCEEEIGRLKRMEVSIKERQRDREEAEHEEERERKRIKMEEEEQEQKNEEEKSKELETDQKAELEEPLEEVNTQISEDKRETELQTDQPAAEEAPAKILDEQQLEAPEILPVEERQPTEESADLEKATSKTFEKNPKSEFVEAQTLPKAALGLFEDAVQGLPVTGEEYLKKKYGVASYPTTDLKDMLPGEIPDADFTKAKPANQVQFSTFLSFLEPYFRPYGEEDISFLKQKSVSPNYTGMIPNPYTVPPLGPLYTNTWATEDGPDPGYSITPGLPYRTSDVIVGSSEALADDMLEANNRISCGPLVSRLLAALLPESGTEKTTVATPARSTPSAGDDSIIKEELDDSAISNVSPGNEEIKQEPNLPTSQSSQVTTTTPDRKITASTLIDPWRNRPVRTDYYTLEERLKREMRYIGVLRKKVGAGGDMNEGDIDWTTTEDDEICFELRKMQKELRRVSRFNAACKRKLIPIVEEHMGYQEYAQILEDLDKQVDQIYLKRTRTIKTKKKKGVATSSFSQADSSNNPSAVTATTDARAVKAISDKRQRWIDKIGPCFSRLDIIRTPSQSILTDLEEEEEEEGEEEEDEYIQ